MGLTSQTRRGPAAVLGSLCLCALAAVGGCTTVVRREPPPALYSAAAPVGFATGVRFLSTDRAAVEARAAEGLQNLHRAAPQGVVRVLAISGGGAGGAFGAGALVGLTRSHERPRYEIVTGVSAGALIAPFAFLGPDWDPQLTEAFTSGRGAGMSLHGLLPTVLGTRSRSAALAALVDHYITRELIEAVAREAATGRLLWVATTDLDKEETVIWDMGKIAAQGGEPARELFRDVLVASASVPGVFSPVLIHVEDAGRSYDEMHVDGNASTSLFVAPTAAYFALLDAPSLAGAQLYVLVNGQIMAAPQATQPTLGSILYRSFSAALKHMSRAQLVAVNQFADKYRMSVHSTYLPFDYPKPNFADFSPATMRPLFAYGARCAERGRLWTTLDETMAVVESAPAARSGTEHVTDAVVDCPLRDVLPRVARQ